jgi:hypothetical protein
MIGNSRLPVFAGLHAYFLSLIVSGNFIMAKTKAVPSDLQFHNTLESRTFRIVEIYLI